MSDKSTVTTSPSPSVAPAPVPPTGRVQLAIDVSDLDAAVAFYSSLFATPPAKVRPGYANFAIADPPLKLVLIESEQGGRLNHLGVEVHDTASVDAAAARLRADGLVTLEQHDEACCYALQDKVWVADPDGARWEVYTVTGDAEVLAPPTDEGARPAAPSPATACC